MALSDLLLNKRYELSRPLGQGAMARVYLARDRFLARRVAVKILHPALGADSRFIARFRREAEAAAGLNHPHIVGVYDVGADGDLHYIIMEYVEGLDLKDLLLQSGPLPTRRAADIGAQVASALQYAHARGMVHRDIKPHNIMVASSGLVKLADLGIARLLSEVSSDDVGATSAAQYIAPEQVRNGPITPRTDLYSLGVVLYEATTGYVPFPGSNFNEVVQSHLHNDPVPPSDLHTDVPSDLEAIILKAMAKSPRDRYSSAEEMGRALQDWDQKNFSSPQTSILAETTFESSPRARRSETSRAAAPRVEPRSNSWRSGCVTRVVGAATLLAVAGYVAFALWGLNNADRIEGVIDIGASPSPTVATTAVVVPTLPPVVAPRPTNTPPARPTDVPTPTATMPVRPTFGSTPTPTATATSIPTPTPTATSVPTPTATATSIPTPTPTPIYTPTPFPTATSTLTPVPGPPSSEPTRPLVQPNVPPSFATYFPGAVFPTPVP